MGEYINSSQARFDKSFCSCGILEVHHLPKNTTQTLFSIANTLYHKANPRPSAFILFSDVINKHEQSRGESLANLIEDTSTCGKLIASSTSINPRTGNSIKVWLLEINHNTFREWYKEELANRIED